MEKLIRVCDDPDCVATDVHSEQTHPFTVDGKEYTIDVCDRHNVQFLAFLELQKKYTAMAHEVADGPPKPARRPSPRREAADGDGAAIRAWAQARGIDIAERGRIPAEVREQWQQQTGQRPPALQVVPPPPPTLRPPPMPTLNGTGQPSQA